MVYRARYILSVDYQHAIFVVSDLGTSKLGGARGWARSGRETMDLATILPFIVQALGGAIGGNVLGAVTRGGGGVVGRTIIGALGGVAAGYAGGNVEAVSGVTSMWSNLIEGENGVHLSNLITGAAGGSILGLISGLLIRPRA